MVCRLDEKIRKLDEQLVKHRDTIKKTRAGPAQDAAKRRALGVLSHPVSLTKTTQLWQGRLKLKRGISSRKEREPMMGEVTGRESFYAEAFFCQVLKQKKMLEGQRDQLYNQQYNMEQTSFALESMKDSVNQVKAMKAANKELKQAFGQKELNIGSIDKLHDDMADMMVQFSTHPYKA